MTTAHPLSRLPRIRIPDLFDGPLDLLTQLVRQREINASGLATVVITEACIEDLRRRDDVTLELWGEFLEAATRLLALKAHLCGLGTGAADSAEEERPEHESLRRMLEHLTLFAWIKARVGDLSACLERAGMCAPRPGEPPAMDATVDDLARAYGRFAPRPEASPEPMASPRLAAQIAEELRFLLPRGRVIRLSRRVRRQEEAIPTLLAMLDLSHRQEASLAVSGHPPDLTLREPSTAGSR